MIVRVGTVLRRDFWRVHRPDAAGLEAFEPGDLPDGAVLRERAREPTRFEHGEHRGRRVRERAELLAERREEQVLRGDDEPRDPVAPRIAEDEQSLRVLCRCRQEPFVVGVAADDAVQDDHVRRLDPGRILGDVADESDGSALEPGFDEQRTCFVVVAR